MLNDIKTTLDALGLVEWQPISVRRKIKQDIQYLGGGTVSNIIRRFGDKKIKKTLLSEGALVIYVE